MIGLIFSCFPVAIEDTVEFMGVSMDLWWDDFMEFCVKQVWVDFRILR